MIEHRKILHKMNVMNNPEDLRLPGNNKVFSVRDFFRSPVILTATVGLSC